MKVSKKILLILISASAFISYSQKMAVTGQINFKQSYCGGARPSAEILAQATKSKPYADKMVMIVSQKGKVDSVKTDANGTFKTTLKAGTYRVFEAWRYYKKATGGMLVGDFDAECLKKEWKKEIKEIIVTKKETKVLDKNEIVEVCPWDLPCIIDSHKPPRPE